jgi:hypothetical protein
MGAWGTAIFADDTAADVRDEWREAILEGKSPEEATSHVVKLFAEAIEDDPDEESVFWMALAAAQMETGRLQPDVRDRALAIIDAGGDVERWAEEDPGLARRRQKVLDRLAAKLRGPQPKPKRIRRRPLYGVPFDVSDIVLLRNTDEGVEALFAVVDQHTDEDTGEVEPVVEALLWEGGEIPSPGELTRLPALLDEGLLPEPADEREPGRPLAPLRPLIFVVSTMTRTEVFGPHFGQVVAKGVQRTPSADFRALNEFGGDAFAHGASWGFLVAWIGGPWYRRDVELTRAAMRGSGAG